MAIPMRRLLIVVGLLVGAAAAVFVAVGTRASASADKSAAAPAATTPQTLVNSATPTTGPVPTRCAGPTVNSNGTITFCLTAPQANGVQLNFQNMFGLSPAAEAFPMTEGSGGLWYITVQPPAGANWYGYNFTADGRTSPIPTTATSGRVRRVPSAPSARGAW
jgi:hypothetical protein